jgi:tripartite-type tricarboxylate transporter receptor subunit TctC
VSGVAVQAQSFPDRPIRFISPFAAGSSTDTIARMIGERLSANIGQPVIVDTRPGANGILGADAAAKSPPDGYTLVLASNGTHGINVSLFSKLPYDPVKDFAPVIHVGQVSYLLLVGNKPGLDSVGDLVKLAKANPGKLNLAYAASVSQLTGELFKSRAGIKMVSVPYKNLTTAFVDLAGGQVDALFEPVTSGLPQVKNGRLKALAVTTAKRSPLAPEVPTIAESGFPGFESAAWIAFFAPAGTPPEIVNKLHAEIERVLQSSEMKEKLLQVGVEVVTSTPAELSEKVKTEIEKWKKTFADSNLPKLN